MRKARKRTAPGGSRGGLVVDTDASAFLSAPMVAHLPRIVNRTAFLVADGHFAATWREARHG